MIEKRSEAAEWYWWTLCANSKCNHHYGYDYGYFHEDPKLVVTKERFEIPI